MGVEHFINFIKLKMSLLGDVVTPVVAGGKSKCILIMSVPLINSK